MIAVENVVARPAVELIVAVPPEGVVALAAVQSVVTRADRVDFALDE